MKNEYQELDNKIKEALTQEEAKYFSELQEQSLPEQVFGIYKGKLGWFSMVITLIMIPGFALTVYAGFKFFQGEELIDMLKWGAILFISLMMVSMLKLFSWNQMDKNAILRELKRIEYQIALLSKK